MLLALYKSGQLSYLQTHWLDIISTNPIRETIGTESATGQAGQLTSCLASPWTIATFVSNLLIVCNSLASVHSGIKGRCSEPCLWMRLWSGQQGDRAWPCRIGLPVHECLIVIKWLEIHYSACPAKGGRLKNLFAYCLWQPEYSTWSSSFLYRVLSLSLVPSKNKITRSYIWIRIEHPIDPNPWSVVNPHVHNFLFTTTWMQTAPILQ